MLAEDHEGERSVLARTEYKPYENGHIYYGDFYIHCASRRGVPQGAATSPMIADHVVSLVLASVQLPAGVELITNYSDNFAIIGPSRKDVEAAVKTLREAFASHQAGELHITENGVRRIADGFDFLGHHFRRKRGTHVTPTLENKKKLLEKIKKCASRIRSEAGDQKAVAALASAVHGWRRSFRHCDGVDYGVWELVNDLARQCADMPEVTNAFRGIASTIIAGIRKQVLAGPDADLLNLAPAS